MIYKEITITFNPFSEAIADGLMSELGTIGFDGFCNTESGFKAYIPEKEFDKEKMETLPYWNLIQDTHQLTWTSEIIPDQDWNAVWESNFTPIVVDNQIMIRAGFHTPIEGIKYDILIDPKMSFGTGHHATTSLMLKTLLDKEDVLVGKRILDMGCGTGILGIMASKLGGAQVVGIDIDEWAYNNAMENIAQNGVHNMEILIGDARLLKDQSPFDIILANINRNILLEDMPAYVERLKTQGMIIMSGFYEQDLAKIKERAAEVGLQFQSFKEQNDWVAAVFIKA